MNSLTDTEEKFLQTLDGIRTPSDPNQEISWAMQLQRAVFQRNQQAVDELFQSGPSRLEIDDFGQIKDELVRVFFEPEQSDLCTGILLHFKQSFKLFYFLSMAIIHKMNALDLPKETRMFALDLIFQHANSDVLETMGNDRFILSREDDILFALKHPRFPELVQKKSAASMGKLDEFFRWGVFLMSEDILEHIAKMVSDEHPISLSGAAERCQSAEQVKFLFSVLKKYPSLKKHADLYDQNLLEKCVSQPSVFQELFKNRGARAMAFDHVTEGRLVRLLDNIPARQAITLFKAKQDHWERVFYYQGSKRTLLEILALDTPMTFLKMTLLKVAIKKDPTIISRSVNAQGNRLILDMLSGESKQVLAEYALRRSVKKTQNFKPKTLPKKM